MTHKAFRFHFNRINMQRGKPEVWTVHTGGQCIQTREIRCQVPVASHFYPTRQQPRVFFTGTGHVVAFEHHVVIRP
jgi:hypothetical protein